jgi:hypothetical protein
MDAGIASIAIKNKMTNVLRMSFVSPSSFAWFIDGKNLTRDSAESIYPLLYWSPFTRTFFPKFIITSHWLCAKAKHYKKTTDVLQKKFYRVYPLSASEKQFFDTVWRP